MILTNSESYLIPSFLSFKGGEKTEGRDLSRAPRAAQKALSTLALPQTPSLLESKRALNSSEKESASSSPLGLSSHALAKIEVMGDVSAAVRNVGDLVHPCLTTMRITGALNVITGSTAFLHAQKRLERAQKVGDPLGLLEAGSDLIKTVGQTGDGVLTIPKVLLSLLTGLTGTDASSFHAPTTLGRAAFGMEFTSSLLLPLISTLSWFSASVKAWEAISFSWKLNRYEDKQEGSYDAQSAFEFIKEQLFSCEELFSAVEEEGEKIQKELLEQAKWLETNTAQLPEEEQELFKKAAESFFQHLLSDEKSSLASISKMASFIDNVSDLEEKEVFKQGLYGSILHNRLKQENKLTRLMGEKVFGQLKELLHKEHGTQQELEVLLQEIRTGVKSHMIKQVRGAVLRLLATGVAVLGAVFSGGLISVVCTGIGVLLAFAMLVSSCYSYYQAVSENPQPGENDEKALYAVSFFLWGAMVASFVLADFFSLGIPSLVISGVIGLVSLIVTAWKIKKVSFSSLEHPLERGKKPLEPLQKRKTKLVDERVLLATAGIRGGLMF